MFVNNEDRIVKSLETIAECMVKSNEMAKEALKKSNRLYGANMAMMREIQNKIELTKGEQFAEALIEGLDGT